MNRQNGYEISFLLGLYERMVLIRTFEERVKLLFLEGSMPGTIHQCQGQEATAVGVCSALNADDVITSTHRPHGHALAKGLTADEIMAELFGKATGCCGGKGGSMHIGNLDKGMVPAIAIVGGALPLAAGIGLAFKMRKESRVVASFFGDGATNEGAFHEAVNLAAIWNLPVIFACENNLYGASTHVSKVIKVPHIADRAAAYGIRGQTVDGNDVVAVYEAAKQAADECRQGKGPVLLELETYRITGHSRRDPCTYQPKEERDWWKAHEPILRFKKVLSNDFGIEEVKLVEIEQRVEQTVEAAVEYARRQPDVDIHELTSDVFTPEVA